MNFGDSKNEVDGMYLNLRGCFYYKMNSFSYNFKEDFEEHVFQNFGNLRYPYTYNQNDGRRQHNWNLYAHRSVS